MFNVVNSYPCVILHHALIVDNLLLESSTGFHTFWETWSQCFPDWLQANDPTVLLWPSAGITEVYYHTW
jgi:hypothetical protein